MKRTELKRTSTLKRTPMRQVSVKQARRLGIYKKIRDEYMAYQQRCEFRNCCFESRELHHKAGRKGNNLFRHFMALCRYHHCWIHSHTRESRELGYLITDDPRRED